MNSALFASRRVLWMPLDCDWQQQSPADGHCCRTMAASLEMSCDMHADPFDCPDVPIIFHKILGEYGIPVRDDGTSYLLISHCHWCGIGLPESCRDLWFDTIEAAGFANTPTAPLPERFRTAQWRLHAQF
jgi:hypothetical protein